MDELDQRGLRDHIDRRFDEEHRYVDKRFEELRHYVDGRFDKIEHRLDVLTDAFMQLTLSIGESSRPANAIVYTVCGTVAVVAVAALLQSLLGG